eukprot:11185332-Lingulodinium_polyedra.AAC.1
MTCPGTRARPPAPRLGARSSGRASRPGNQGRAGRTQLAGLGSLRPRCAARRAFVMCLLHPLPYLLAISA